MGDNLLLLFEDFALDTDRRELRRGNELRPADQAHVRFGSLADVTTCPSRTFIDFHKQFHLSKFETCCNCSRVPGFCPDNQWRGLYPLELA